VHAGADLKPESLIDDACDGHRSHFGDCAERMARAFAIFLASPAAYATASPGSTDRDDQGEYDGLKHSSSVRGLAHLVGLSPQMTFCLCWNFNFFLMLALIYWKGWPKLVAALLTRFRLIKRGIEEAEQYEVEARERIAAIERGWARLDSEFASMQRVSDTVLKHEERALRAKTAEDTRRILGYAEDEVKMAALRERRELKAFAADLAASIARQSIRVDKTTDRRLIRVVVKKLEQSGEFSQPTTEASAKAAAYA
jgi:F0F1-type ATP synthase membrane subunit b/b'